MGVGNLKVEAGKLLEQTWRAVPLGTNFADDPAMAAWGANYRGKEPATPPTGNSDTEMGHPGHGAHQPGADSAAAISPRNNGWRLRAARRPGAGVRGREGHPRVVRQLRGAAGRSRDRRHLHLPAQQPAPRVDDQGRGAGKHVLCEKPLALSVEDVDGSPWRPPRYGVVMAEAFMYRHHPQTLKVRELIDEGAIGRLQLVRGGFTFILSGPTTSGSSRSWAAAASGTSAATRSVTPAPRRAASRPRRSSAGR